MASAYMDDQVRRRAGSMSDVDWREMNEKNDRWSGFSDEELRALARRLAPYGGEGDDDVLSAARDELADEQNRREAERSSYCGPGRYQHAKGETYEVLGTADGGSADPRVIIMRHSSGSYYYEREDNFEMPFGERRRYEYIGPLEREVVPTEVKLIDAGEDWAVLETFDRKRFRLVKGDTFTVPTLVIS